MMIDLVQSIVLILLGVSILSLQHRVNELEAEKQRVRNFATQSVDFMAKVQQIIERMNK